MRWELLDDVSELEFPDHMFRRMDEVLMPCPSCYHPVRREGLCDHERLSEALAGTPLGTTPATHEVLSELLAVRE
jgi:hypothetical protein